MKKTLLPTLLIWTSLTLVGCATQSGPKLTNQGPTLAEIYHTHMNHARSDTGRPFYDHSILLGAREGREFSLTAPRFLRNPTLHMYVYPHLATVDEVPIPGYWTVFPLYAKNHYALPGEL